MAKKRFRPVTWAVPDPVRVEYWPTYGYVVTNEGGDVLATAKTRLGADRKAKARRCTPINQSWRSYLAGKYFAEEG